MYTLNQVQHISLVILIMIIIVDLKLKFILKVVFYSFNLKTNSIHANSANSF
jgi:hypothetical protein